MPDAPPTGELIPIPRAVRRWDDPRPNERRGGALAGEWTPDELGLPLETPCPIKPVGRDSAWCYLIDSRGKLQRVRDKRLSRRRIRALFEAAPNYLLWAWPRRADDGEIIRPVEDFDTDRTRVALLRACSTLGPLPESSRKIIRFNIQATDG